LLIKGGFFCVKITKCLWFLKYKNTIYGMAKKVFENAKKSLKKFQKSVDKRGWIWYYNRAPLREEAQTNLEN